MCSYGLRKANKVLCVIWQYDYSATLWTLQLCGIVIFVSSRRRALHAGGQLLPFPIIALRSRLSSRPPARPSSSLSVLLCFALFAPVLVQNETSQVSLPFSLFPALLFPVSVLLAADFFFPPPSSNSCCRRATALPLSVSFRSRRLYNLGTLRL
jgi:hypothetical protein